MHSHYPKHSELTEWQQETGWQSIATDSKTSTSASPIWIFAIFAAKFPLHSPKNQILFHANNGTARVQRRRRRRSRRRCGPPVGCTRLLTPWCLPAPTDLDRQSMTGTLTVCPVRFSIMTAALLPISSPWTPDPRNTLTVCSRYQPGALEGGRGRESSSTSGPGHPPRGGDTVTRVWALSPPATAEGRRLAGGSRGLGPSPDPTPRRTALVSEVPVRGKASPPLAHIPAGNVPEVGDCPG